MPTGYHIAEFHLFQMFGKNILFNVDTMLFYEVSPVVYDIADLLSNPTQPDPVTFLKSSYPETEIKEAMAYLITEGFLQERQALPAKKSFRPIKQRGIMRTTPSTKKQLLRLRRTCHEHTAGNLSDSCASLFDLSFFGPCGRSRDHFLHL